MSAYHATIEIVAQMWPEACPASGPNEASGWGYGRTSTRQKAAKTAMCQLAREQVFQMELGATTGRRGIIGLPWQCLSHKDSTPITAVLTHLISGDV